MAVRRTCPARRDEGSPRESERFMNIFAKPRAGLNLTPAERTLLKLVQGWIIAGLISAAGTFITPVSQPHPAGADLPAGFARAIARTTFRVAPKIIPYHTVPR